MAACGVWLNCGDSCARREYQPGQFAAECGRARDPFAASAVLASSVWLGCPSRIAPFFLTGACGPTLWHARHMNSRLRRFVGTVSVVALFAGCAADPSQTNQASASGRSVRTAASAPVAHGEAVPPEIAALKLADAKPIDETIPDVSRFKQTGRASWYGKRFNGRRTASGERFDMNALTAAHKTLPLAAYVRVTNTANQKSVIVRINDRGPYVRGRVIDLSYAAACELGLHNAGTGRVKIEGLSQEAVLASRKEVVASAGLAKGPSQP